jgi:hypothetical protein
MNIQDLKEFDFLVGDDSYIIIGASSNFTVEVFNINTWQEETIEGDYCDNGNIDHLKLTNKGNIDEYLSKIDSRAVIFKSKITNKVNELKEYYYA